FREEAVAGVDGLSAGLGGGGENPVDAQVAVGRLVAAQGDGHVGVAHVLGVAVGVGVHRHALHAEAPEGADGADSDLATVGNQYGIEHGGALSLSLGGGGVLGGDEGAPAPETGDVTGAFQGVGLADE